MQQGFSGHGQPYPQQSQAFSPQAYGMQPGYALDALCKIRNAATNAVVDALDNDRGDRIAYPEDSFGGVDPCTRLETAERGRKGSVRRIWSRLSWDYPPAWLDDPGV